MARQSRQQRRARRAQAQPALAGGPPSSPPARPTERGGDEPSRRPQRAHERSERHVPGFGFFRFLRESYGELKKVEWPTQRAVISGTAVVVIACAIVGAYLWVNDRVWQYVVHHLLLR